jgi:hypothetical protein
MDWLFLILIILLAVTFFLVGFSVGQDVTRVQIAREEAEKAQERLNMQLEREKETSEHYKYMYGK